MVPPPSAACRIDEYQRQYAVEQSGVLRRGGDPELQNIVERAASCCRTPIAAISIIDKSRQWFAAKQGFHQSETPRSESFCASAILRPGESLVVPDAQKDPRFRNFQTVLGPPHVRFYAGMPLVDRHGYPLGALCVIDTKPHSVFGYLYELKTLAREAERLISRP